MKVFCDYRPLNVEVNVLKTHYENISSWPSKRSCGFRNPGAEEFTSNKQQGKLQTKQISVLECDANTRDLFGQPCSLAVIFCFLLFLFVSGTFLRSSKKIEPSERLTPPKWSASEFQFFFLCSTGLQIIIEEMKTIIVFPSVEAQIHVVSMTVVVNELVNSVVKATLKRYDYSQTALWWSS